MKLELYGQIFEKYSDINYHENPSSWRRVVTLFHADGRTDRLDETNCCFSQFCERAWKCKISFLTKIFPV